MLLLLLVVAYCCSESFWPPKQVMIVAKGVRISWEPENSPLLMDLGHSLVVPHTLSPLKFSGGSNVTH